MLNLDKLNEDRSLMDKVQRYVVGMADAKAELLQQEVDMMHNPDLDDDRYGVVLECRIDKLTHALLILSDPKAYWIPTIQHLDKWFGFLSEPDALVNSATRHAAIEMCRCMLLEHNKAILEDDIDQDEIDLLNSLIKYQNEIRMALTHYEVWMEELTE